MAKDRVRVSGVEHHTIIVASAGCSTAGARTQHRRGG